MDTYVRKVHTAIETLISALRDANFIVTYRVWCGSAVTDASGAAIDISRPSAAPGWSHRISVSCRRNSGLVRDVNSRIYGQRVVTYRRLGYAQVKKLVQRAEDDLAAHHKSEAEMAKYSRLKQAWLEQADRDFKDWKVPTFLRNRHHRDEPDGLPPHQKFMQFGGSGERQIGRYSLVFVEEPFVNLTAGQVKAVCKFIADTLPGVK